MKRIILTSILLLICALPANAAQIAAVSFDWFSQSSLALTTPGASAPTAINPLSGVLTTAGLVYANGVLYGIANDGWGFTINAFDLDGIPVDAFGSSSSVSLPTDLLNDYNIWHGLAFSQGYFYSLAVNLSGTASLVKLNASGGVDTIVPGPLENFFAPFSGGAGLTFSGSTLYGISTDFLGVSTLYPIDLLSGSLGTGMLLGEGFSGGLTFGDGKFYAVRNDFQGFSYLNSFAWNGIPTEGGELGAGANGYLGGLAFVPTPIPEPNTILLVGAGIAGIALSRIRRRR